MAKKVLLVCAAAVRSNHFGQVALGFERSFELLRTLLMFVKVENEFVLFGTVRIEAKFPTIYCKLIPDDGTISLVKRRRSSSILFLLKSMSVRQ